MAVFVERTLTARKGKKRVALQLRVHAPVDRGDHWRCRAELRAGQVLVWPSTPDFEISGHDGWQALVLALRVAAQSVLLFERSSAMHVDAADWLDVIELLGESAIPDDMKPRVAEIEHAIGESLREYRETHDHDHDHDHEHTRTASPKKRTAIARSRRGPRRRAAGSR